MNLIQFDRNTLIYTQKYPTHINDIRFIPFFEFLCYISPNQSRNQIENRINIVINIIQNVTNHFP